MDGMNAQHQEQILYCQDCFAAGSCPPEARREQTTLDNQDVAIVCADCRDKMLSGFMTYPAEPNPPMTQATVDAIKEHFQKPRETVDAIKEYFQEHLGKH